MTNPSWLPYPGSPTQWFSRRWPQTTTNGASQPAFLLQPVGTTPGAWSASGTGLGINAASGYTGNLLDLQVGGASRATFPAGGGLLLSATGGISLTGSYVPAAYSIAGANGNTINIGGSGHFRFTGAGGAENLSIVYNWGTRLRSADAFGWSSTTDSQGTSDLAIYRDAANTLAQRNGTNAQTFRVYNTYTSATNYERAKLEWSSNALKVGTEKGSGGGTARPMSLQTDATDRLTITAVGTAVINTGFTVATLPGTPTTGEIARVTDALAPAMGSTVVGGGAAFALVVYNGANWRVFAI